MKGANDASISSDCVNVDDGDSRNLSEICRRKVEFPVGKSLKNYKIVYVGMEGRFGEGCKQGRVVNRVGMRTISISLYLNDKKK